MQQHVFFLRPNGILVSYFRVLYYCNENGTIFILHVFAYYELNAYFCMFSMIVFIEFKLIIIKPIKV